MRRPAGWLLCIALAWILTACGDAEQDEHAHEEQEASHSEDGGSDMAGVVTIDPEMLRDLRITTAPAEARLGGEGVTVLGEVKVNEDAYAEIAASFSGRVTRLLAAPGDRIAEGAPLLEVESNELGKAKAEYMSARARAELARRALERKRGLVDERIAARRELQETEAEASAAEAELGAARVALTMFGMSDAELARGIERGGRLTLRAPISGIVLARGVVNGQAVEPGHTLFRIADLSTLWLTVHAFERDAVRVQAGRTARVAFPALPGRSFSGAVAVVGSEVDTTSRTIPIRIELANEEGSLRPGMSATAWLALGDSGASIVAVPAAALQRTQEGWCVFLPRDDGSFEMRNVGRGRDLGGEVEVLSGIAAGEKVVVDGAFLLKAEAEKARGEGGHHDH
jgi:membrane fusion protein, heavy metal efflux system